nr:basic salivary proline-rich protein 2-like [Anas platyrhynchos]
MGVGSVGASGGGCRGWWVPGAVGAGSLCPRVAGCWVQWVLCLWVLCVGAVVLPPPGCSQQGRVRAVPLPVPQQHPAAAAGTRGGGRRVQGPRRGARKEGDGGGGVGGWGGRWGGSTLGCRHPGSQGAPPSLWLLAGLGSASPPCLGGSCCHPEEFPPLAAFPHPLLTPPLRDWAPFPSHVLHPPRPPLPLLPPPPQLGAPNPGGLPKTEPFPLGPHCPPPKKTFPGLLGGSAVTGGPPHVEKEDEDEEDEEEEEEEDEGRHGAPTARSCPQGKKGGSPAGGGGQQAPLRPPAPSRAPPAPQLGSAAPLGWAAGGQSSSEAPAPTPMTPPPKKKIQKNPKLCPPHGSQIKRCAARGSASPWKPPPKTSAPQTRDPRLPKRGFFGEHGECLLSKIATCNAEEDYGLHPHDHQEV